MRLARIGTWGRPRFLAVFAALCGGFACGPLNPARADQKEAPAPESRTLTTEDNVSLHITYYGSTLEKEAAVVVLLHQKDGNRFVWQGEKDGLAKRLQDAGFAVITVDLRQHGESKIGGAAGLGNSNQGKKKGKKEAGLDLKPVEYELMVEQDMEAVKEFIFTEHQAGRLNMNKMAIVGAEMGASIAAAYAVFDWNKPPYEDGQPGYQTPRGQDVRALVLISPQEKFHGMLMSKAVQFLKDPDLGIALFVCNGTDPKDEAQAKKIMDMITTPVYDKKRMAHRTYTAKLTKTDLLDKGLGIEDDIVAFLSATVKKIDSPWRDRRSKRARIQSKK